MIYNQDLPTEIEAQWQIHIYYTWFVRIRSCILLGEKIWQGAGELWDEVLEKEALLVGFFSLP